jgi:putative membrane protein
MRLTPDDHAKVTAAVAAAEQTTAGEIVTVVAGQSDRYSDVPQQAGVLAAVLALAVLAVWPGIAVAIDGLLHDPWGEAPAPGALLTTALVAAIVAFLAGRYAAHPLACRMALTPASTKARRVRRQALALFRTAAEARTVGSTGVLLYLSLAEHRAELIADKAIHSKVSGDVWGAAMAALVDAVKDGRPGDGMAEAVRQIGLVLAEHFPRDARDTNELPDRLIEL